MGELLAEVLLRGAKVLAAIVVGAILYLVMVGPLGIAGSPELALLAYLAGAATVLLAESSPI